MLRPPEVTYERPRLTVSCIGTKNKRHTPIDVITYARHEDGTWLPLHSGVRINAKAERVDYLVPETGMRPGEDAMVLPCPSPRCTYNFQHPASKVLPLFDKAIKADEHEVFLLTLDTAIRLGL